MKLKVAILKSESAFEHEQWVIACEGHPEIGEYDVIELTSNDWLNKVLQKNYDLFLLRPPGRTELFKRLYDERVFVISAVLMKKIYPSLQEVYIYENKRLLRDWLMANNISHPQTMIFFNVDEALSFINQSDSYPVVGKTNIGASGSGVTILKSKEDSIKYIINAFTKGVKSISGPKIFKGSILKKINKLITKKDFLRHRLKEYEATVNQVQKGFVIFQEYIPHSFEWRCVRIGESYFAHKKMVKNEMASGTLTKGYENPPLALMDFIKKITDEFSLKSVSIDLFQTGDKFLINEIQCFFGQSDPYQMLIDGKPGRYKNVNNSWIFEEGMFNTNQSYDLRVEHALSLINKRT